MKESYAISADVAVVGGGVVGLCVSHDLAAAGAATTLWEAGHPGGGASAEAHGQLVPPAGPLRPLFDDSVARYEQLAAEDAGEVMDRDPCGALVLDTASAQAVRDDGEPLSAAEARACEPALGPAVRGAVWLPQARRIDPRRLIALLAEVARAQGVAVRGGSPVVELIRVARGWQLRTVQGDRVTYRTVILAAGRHSVRLRPDLPIMGVRGRVLRTAPHPPLLRHIVGEPVRARLTVPTLAQVAAQDPAEAHVGLLLHQRPDGVLLIGASWQHAWQPDPPGLDGVVARRAIQLVPALAEARIGGAWSGVRPETPDGMPIVDQIDESLFVCAGHGGSGFIAGPGSARLVAELVLGRPPFTDPRPFRHHRLGSATSRSLPSHVCSGEHLRWAGGASATPHRP